MQKAIQERILELVGKIEDRVAEIQAALNDIVFQIREEGTEE